MNDGSVAVAAHHNFWWKASELSARLRSWLVQRLLGLVVRLTGDTNMMAHARRELPDPNIYDINQMAPIDVDEMQLEMNRGLLQLLAVFAAQGHSGFSASYATSMLEKLMRFEPLGPLTGADEEWFDHGDGMFQNMRCGHVFKQADRFDGQAYDLDGRIFREPSGSCYTNRDSMVPITFPYTPKREYVDVPASAD